MQINTKICVLQELDFSSEMEESSTSSSSTSSDEEAGTLKSHLCRSCRTDRKKSGTTDDSSEKETSTEGQTAGQELVFV